MSDSQIITERETLMDMLTDMLGALVTVVTIDAQAARPLPGKAAVLIDPPEITYEGWQFVSNTWTVNLIAGTPATQTESLDLLIPVLERLHERHLNMKTAKPVTYDRPGVGNLAAYEITLNPLEIN